MLRAGLNTGGSGTIVSVRTTNKLSKGKRETATLHFTILDVVRYSAGGERRATKAAAAESVVLCAVMNEYGVHFCS